MLGHKIIANSQRLASLGVGNHSFCGRFYGLASPVLLTSDPKNQNKRARGWNGDVISASFKTSSTPDAPLANVRFVEDQAEDSLEALLEDLAAGEHEFAPDRSRELSQTVEYYHFNTSPSYVNDYDRPNDRSDFSLDIQRNHDRTHAESIPSSIHCTSMEQVESYDCRGTVSLHSVMQSMVPDPYRPNSTAPTHVNMPGGGHMMTLRYLNDRELDLHQSRHHSTSAAYRRLAARKFSMFARLNANVEMQGVQGDIETLKEVLDKPFPQGIQGEDCARFALWMKNCGRFGDCTEQLEAVRSGRKTLQQIFDEQDRQIRLAAEKLSSTATGLGGNTNVQGVQGDVDMIMEVLQATGSSPSAQGIQGENCARFALWMKNCGHFGDCTEQLEAVKSGRKTLQQIFDEQDEQIRLAAEKLMSSAEESVSPGSASPPNSSSTGPSPSSGGEKTEQQQSQRERLKKAVRDYGATVIVFHIGISLISLGGFYVLVKSGIDLVGILERFGVAQSFFESKLAAGASTFVVAYAVHKVFAPVRIGITLTATPFIVRYLRRVGILKAQKAVSTVAK